MHVIWPKTAAECRRELDDEGNVINRPCANVFCKWNLTIQANGFGGMVFVGAGSKLRDVGKADETGQRTMRTSPTNKTHGRYLNYRSMQGEIDAALDAALGWWAGCGYSNCTLDWIEDGPMTLDDLVMVMGISREGVRQAEVRGAAAMADSDELRDFFEWLVEREAA